MVERINPIGEKLNAFKKKYYLSLSIRGFMISVSIILLYYLLATFTEYNFWLAGNVRFIVFTLFIALVIFCFISFLKKPILWLFLKKGITQEDSAIIIGKHFPEINDRLLNAIQLQKMQQSSSLAVASFFQKLQAFKDIHFEDAVDLKTNKNYAKFIIVPVTCFVLVFLFNKSLLIESTSRIINFSKEFSPRSPFNFVIENKSLSAFINEDFTLKVKITGEKIPDAVYLNNGNNKFKLIKKDQNFYVYTFEKIQNSISFQLEAAGFFSTNYKLDAVSRPELTSLKLIIQYPEYLHKKFIEIKNAGDIEISEGSMVSWRINTVHAKKANIFFSSNQENFLMERNDNEIFNFNKGFRNSDQYTILLENDKSKNKETISNSIVVVKDQFPEIQIRSVKDTLFYKAIFLSGELNDDYGISGLSLIYEIDRAGAISSHRENILVNSSAHQIFHSVWNIDSLHLKPGDRLSYHLSVGDNDGVNGSKYTKSKTEILRFPDEKKLKEQISVDQDATKSKIEEGNNKAKKLHESIENAKQTLKGKHNLNWQDKKKIEEILIEKQKLNTVIQDLKEKNKLLEKRKESFVKESESVRQKSAQIQKLMNELMNEETIKLFEELQKLLKENADPSQLQKMLDKIDRKEIDLEKELERALELFKSLQLEFKLDQSIKQIDEQIKEQEAIREKTKELDENSNRLSKEEINRKSENSLEPQQNQLNNKLNDFKETIEELQKLQEEQGKEVQNQINDRIEEIDKNQKKSKENIKDGILKDAQKSQKKALDKMIEIKEELQNSANELGPEIDLANVESLRQIIHGLIKISFDQEKIMKDFGNLQQTDPKYLQLSQQQIKIKNDSKVLEDSLLAVSKRDAFMGNFVIKEIGELNDHFNKANDHVKERRKQNAVAEMQFSMASVNNLALLIDDHFNALLKMIEESKPGKGKSKKGNNPSLSQLQKSINKRMMELQKGNSIGRKYSEELARMAAEQESIRRALEQIEHTLRQNGGKLGNENLSKEMERTEMDLVNKELSEQTIKRQQDILTRLLEKENSMREQDEEQERKAETSKDYENKSPTNLQGYLQMKQLQTELLKTIPVKLSPYYKREVNSYFKRLETDNIY